MKQLKQFNATLLQKMDNVENLNNGKNIAIIKSFIATSLHQKINLQLPGYDVTRERDEFVLNTVAVLRRLCDELESTNANVIDTLISSISVTPSNIFLTLKGISDELFITGKNWGRIIAFLTFGAKIAIYCVSSGELGIDYVESVENWISNYITFELGSWMKQNGDWEGLLKYFSNSNNSRFLSPSNFVVLTLAGFGVGAILKIMFK